MNETSKSEGSNNSLKETALNYNNDEEENDDAEKKLNTTAPLNSHMAT